MKIVGLVYIHLSVSVVVLLARFFEHGRSKYARSSSSSFEDGLVLAVKK